MKITYLGHAATAIETGDYHILIDPFLTGNPTAAANADEVKADAILITHAHSDHVGDAVAIAKRTGAKIVTIFELAAWLSSQGVEVHPLHLGGSHEFEFGKVKLTLAFHGSGIETENGLMYGGNPAGILFTAEGKTVYHAGDTGLFGDMKVIGERNNIDLALLPIGDNFTMGPEDALTAAEWVKAKAVVPIHYDTFPLIAQDVEGFVKNLEASGIKGYPIKPGESVTI